MGGRLIDYIAQGLAGNIPLATDMPARIAAGGASIYYEQDTGGFKFFNSDTVAWVTFVTQTNENIQDMIAAFLANGAGITLTYNDAGNLLTIACTVTQYTDEMAQDAIAAMLTPGSGITAVYNDAGNIETISCTLTQYTDAMADTRANARIAASSINALADVDTVSAAPASGNVLTWSNALSQWGPAAPAAGYTDAQADTRANARIAAASINALADVDTVSTAPASGNVLTWSFALSQWVPAAASSGTPAPITSWGNGNGERRGLIIATATGSPGGNPNDSLSGQQQGNFYWGGTAGPQQIVFDFGTATVVDGFLVLQDSTANQGDWNFDGSNDNATWTTLAAGWTLTPVTGNGVNMYKLTFVNSTAYRYHRIIKVAGSTNGGPYVRYFGFRCGPLK